jgi:ketosteroid isomerase-like protein
MLPLYRRAALAAIGAGLIATSLHAAEPSADVASAVEALRVAMIAGDEAKLNAMTDDHLSYGHSHGLVQTKPVFVKYLVGPKAPGKFLSIKLSDQTVDVVGDVALVRHVFDGQNELPDGKITTAHILVLQVWKNEAGVWKLLARQACPLE